MPGCPQAGAPSPRSRRSERASSPTPVARPRPAAGRAPRTCSSRRSAVDQLYTRLLDQIARGILTGGQRLPSESRLGSDFGVSRPVVREAIPRLRAGGHVPTRHGSGTFVVGQPKEQSIKLAPIAGASALGLCFELRTSLECEAAILAARR